MTFDKNHLSHCKTDRETAILSSYLSTTSQLKTAKSLWLGERHYLANPNNYKKYSVIARLRARKRLKIVHME